MFKLVSVAIGISCLATPLVSQTTQQQGTENVFENNNNVTISCEQASIIIPEFRGQIQPFDPRQRNAPENELENKFNLFMLNNDGGIVYLNISPYYTDEDLEKGFDRFEPLQWFSVPERSTYTGVEYLVRGHDSEDFFYDSRQSSRQITGYFKIVGVTGPQQGYMSVTLVPLSLQEALLLKR